MSNQAWEIQRADYEREHRRVQPVHRTCGIGENPPPEGPAPNFKHFKKCSNGGTERALEHGGVCRRCGEKLLDAYKFCPECGNSTGFEQKI